MNLNENLLQKIAANVSIFEGMPRQCLINLLNLAENWPMKAGDPFFVEGDKSRSFYILLGGEASVERLSDGVNVELAKIKPGGCFGEMALVDSSPRSATVRAITDTIALRFPKEKLDTQPEAAAYVYRNIAKILVGRLATTNAKVMEMNAELKKYKPKQPKPTIAPSETPDGEATETSIPTPLAPSSEPAAQVDSAEKMPNFPTTNNVS